MHHYSQYHVYSLPVEILQTLTPRNLVNNVVPREQTPEPQTVTVSGGTRTCNICPGTIFHDLEEQRTHFKSDWHRYNVKIRIGGGNPVSDATFVELVEGLEDSISGSASSSSEDDSEDSDAVNALVNKIKHLERPVSPDSTLRQMPQTALIWFHSPPSTQIGVYKALFSNPKDTSSYLSELQEMQKGRREGRTWAMFMVAGGHFAGAIVRVQNLDENEDGDITLKKKKPKKPRPDVEVIRHKTFHRYTTRRKQGGSQSVNDNAKGPAKSAGAQLRRYGEQALRDDIQNLLSEWAEDISECERVWIRASVSNRKIFLDYNSEIIRKGDQRLRTFPFPTRRPTQSELSRCLLELTRVKISHLTEDALRAQDEAYLASLPKPKVIAVVTPETDKAKQPKITKEEEILREKWSRLLEMVNKGRLGPLKAFWEREASIIGPIDVLIPEWTGERRSTLLQLSAQAGHEDMTHWLLEEARADPTVPVPVAKTGELEEEDDGNISDASDTPSPLLKGLRRTAYDLAQNKAVRDVFRRSAAAHPEWWDWFGAGRVPSALSERMEQERDEKKKVRRKGLKERVKEREARERERAGDQPPVSNVPEVAVAQESQPSSGSRRLGGGASASEGIFGLTPEMRAKVERERRARAAEARLKIFGSR